jgi:hypothetical protein
VNTQARYNVCPTTTIDTIVGQNGERQFMSMRRGLVPSWWSKPLKELKLATFYARAETVAKKPFGKRSNATSEKFLIVDSLPPLKEKRVEVLSIGRAPTCRFLFRGLATLIVHLAAVEAHDQIVAWSCSDRGPCVQRVNC